MPRQLSSMILALAALLLLSGAPLRAQDGAKKESKDRAERRQRIAKNERLKKLIKRYKSLSPAKRKAMLVRFREQLKNRTPAERKRLRQLAKRLKQGERKERERLERKRRQLSKQPAERQQAYKKLVRGVIRTLPQTERDALAKLEPQQRRVEIKRLIQDHRQQLVRRQLAALPLTQRDQMQRSLHGLEGKERFREARRMVETYARARAQEILRDERLSPEQKRRKLQQLGGRFLPKGRRREAFLQRWQEGKVPARDRRPDARPLQPGDRQEERRKRLLEQRQRELRERQRAQRQRGADGAGDKARPQRRPPRQRPRR